MDSTDTDGSEKPDDEIVDYWASWTTLVVEIPGTDAWIETDDWADAWA